MRVMIHVFKPRENWLFLCNNEITVSRLRRCYGKARISYLFPEHEA